MIGRRLAKRNVMPGGTCAIETSAPPIRAGLELNGFDNAAPGNPIAVSRMAKAVPATWVPT
jgi:hypothetical protein